MNPSADNILPSLYSSIDASPAADSWKNFSFSVTAQPGSMTELPVAQPQQRSTVHIYKAVVTPEQLDRNNHLNNAEYFDLFSRARLQRLADRGFPEERLRELNIGPVLLNISAVEFLKEILLGEKITIETEQLDFARKVGWSAQRMYREDGTLCCQGKFLSGFIDMTSRRLIVPDQKMKDALLS